MEEERTNGETLIWVQSLKGYGQASLSSAISFWHFDGDHRQLKSWKERFLMEHKKIKQQIQTRLMRECGGTGDHFLNPPRDYVPDKMKSGNTCVVCESNSKLKTLWMSKLEVFTRMFSRGHFQGRLLRWLSYLYWVVENNNCKQRREEETSYNVSNAKKTNQTLVEKLH